MRKALGARRREILFQFLAEAVVLTSGRRALGSCWAQASGLAVHADTGFPISLLVVVVPLGLLAFSPPWDLFGMVPAAPRGAARSDRGPAIR